MTRIEFVPVTEIENTERWQKLAMEDTYCLGAVVDTGLSTCLYFGCGLKNGESLEDFKDTALQKVGIADGDKETTDVFSCMITGDKRGKIKRVFFVDNPGKVSDDQDFDDDKARKRIQALVEKFSPDVCDSCIVVGWIGNPSAYFYFPKCRKDTPLLLQNVTPHF